MRNYKLSDKATRWQQICAQIQFPRSSAMLSLKLIQFIVLPFEFMYSKLPPQLLENSQLTLMEEWRCWCATFTIRAITAHPTSPFMEQHTRANLVFSSDFVLHTHHIFQFFPLKLVYFWTKIRKSIHGCFFHSLCTSYLNFGTKNNERILKTLIFASYTEAPH